MNKIKRIAVMITALVIAFSVVTQAAEYLPITGTSTGTYGNFSYKITNGNATITSCKSTASNITIPSKIGNVPVTTIGAEAFNFMGMTSVTIPDSVTKIDDEAFSSCNALKEIIIPDSVITIGNAAFERCLALTNITIPASVKNIGAFAFRNCEKLVSVVLPDSLENVSSDAFSNCEKLEFVFFTGTTKCTYLKYGLFGYDSNRPKVFYKVDNDYNLEDYVLFDKNKTTLLAFGRADKYYKVPDTVKIIDEVAFEYNLSLIGVSLPKGLKNIKRRAFADIPTLRYISIPSSISLIEGGAFYNCKNLTEVHFGGTSENWKTITINSGNTNLTDAIMKYNSGITFDTENSVVFTEDMKTLLYFEPSKDTYLISQHRPSTYVIPDTVTEIASNAFNESKELLQITIPDSVTTIGYGAFNDCFNLKTVFAGSAENWIKISFASPEANPMYYAYEIFFNDEVLTELTVPESVTEIGKYALYNIRSLRKVTLHDSVTSIGTSAFSGCSNLEEVTLGKSVTEIPSGAFYKCSSLKSINLSNSLTSIENSAFNSCKALEHVSIPDSVTNIESSAFSNSSALTTACLPENKLNTIPVSMFENCSALEKVYIPSNITKFSNNAFYNCKALSDIYFGGTEEEWNRINIDSTNTDLWLATIHFEHEHTINNWTVIIPGDEFTDGVETGRCSECGYEDLKVTPSYHTHKYDYVVTTPVSCVKDGLGTYTCSCSDSYTEEIPATGHTETTVPGTDPTCTKPGFTECKKCSDCDTVLTSLLEIPAKGHTSGEWEVVIEAEVGKEGKEQQKCSVCDAVLDERTIPALPDEPSTEPDEPSTEPDEPSTEPDEPSTEPDEPSTEPDFSYTVGDANGDGKINAIDARIILRISAQLEKIENYNVPVAVFDLTGDGKVNALDARKALRIGAKLE